MRYSEEQAKRPMDFSPRNRWPTIVQFALLFILSYATILACFAFTSGVVGFSVWSFAFVAVLAGFITYIVNYSRDLLLATEFQNAIFANALGTNYLFSIIVRKDGGIVFADRGTQNYLPRYSRIRHTNINDICEISEIQPEHKQTINERVAYLQKESLLLNIRLDDGTYKDIVLSITPLERPGDFMLLRARAYSEKRGGSSDPDMIAMRAQKENLEALLHRSPVGMLHVNSQGIITFANRTFEELLGYGKGYFNRGEHQLAGLIVSGVSHLESGKYKGELPFHHARSNQLSSFYADVRTAKGFRDEESIVIAVYPDGLPKVSTTVDEVQHIPADAMPVQHMPAVVSKPVQHTPAEDVQEASRTASQAASDANSDTLIDLFEGAPIAIVRCNNDGQIIHVNKAFDQLVKLEDSPRPKHLLDLVADDKRDEVTAAVSDLFDAKSDVQHVDVECVLPNSEPVAVSIFASKSDVSDVITFYLVDVTEQKNLELRFAHSQKMQAVGQLAGGVAHDFNNLLTAMIGFCDLLLMRHPAGDQSFADIMQIKQNANRAANLVRQLLAFSRRQTLQATNIDVTEVLAELSNLIRRLIGENIELKMIHGRDLRMVKADQGQLEQVIINLAVNARDAMMDGGILSVRSSNIVISNENPLPRQMRAPAGEDGMIPNGEYVLIEVSDTGTGIPKEVIAKIFEPFFSTKEIGSGTGLGLATVYGIIKQTGGYIYVNSVDGKGTQFHIYFPALSADEERAAETEAEVEEKKMQDLTGRETILLVEDETPVRAFATRALKNKGYTVLEADCAEAALELVRDHGSKLDLIVTDVIMPGMNGPNMVEQISVDFPNIKVVFMSGYAEDVFMNNYGSERSFNFLAKPFTLKQLAAKVKEVLTT